MSFGKYILDDDGNPRREDDLMKWATWFEKAERQVGLTDVGDVVVSTVFLGLDHGWGTVRIEPILWETMVFGGKLDLEINRCAGSKEQAEAMHQDMVERVRAVELLHQKSE